MHTGSCLCGEITFEFPNPPARTGVCHCKNCQRQAGSAFSTIAAVPKAEFTLRGTPKRYLDSNTASGNTVERHFRGKCGSPIFSVVAAANDMIFVKTGTMDDTGFFTPAFHVWCDSKQAWVELDDSVPQRAN